MARVGRGTSRAGKGEFRFTLTADPPVSVLAHMYAGAARELSDYRPALLAIAREVERGLGDIMATKGGALGEQWPEPASEYSKRKTLEGFGDMPLMRTGALREHVARPDVISMGPFRIAQGIDDPQAQALNFGRWPFWGISDDMAKRSESMLEDFIDDVLQRADQRLQRSA